MFETSKEREHDYRLTSLWLHETEYNITTADITIIIFNFHSCVCSDLPGF